MSALHELQLTQTDWDGFLFSFLLLGVWNMEHGTEWSSLVLSGHIHDSITHILSHLLFAKENLQKEL